MKSTCYNKHTYVCGIWGSYVGYSEDFVGCDSM